MSLTRDSSELQPNQTENLEYVQADVRFGLGLRARFDGLPAVVIQPTNTLAYPKFATPNLLPDGRNQTLDASNFECEENSRRKEKGGREWVPTVDADFRICYFTVACRLIA